MEPYFSQSRDLVRPRFDERVGDLERSAACDQLSQAFASGRLDEAELDDRLAHAVRAQTRHDLYLTVRDLGAPAPQPVQPAPPMRRSWSGGDLLAAIVLLGCVISIGGMLVGSVFISPAWFASALVGGMFAFMAGVTATHLVQRRLRPTSGPGAGR